MAIDLTVASLDELHRRRSEKWSLHPPDVLSSTIAEMDFPVAEPVARALREAIDRNDLGYAPPASASLRHAFAGVRRTPAGLVGRSRAGLGRARRDARPARAVPGDRRPGRRDRVRVAGVPAVLRAAAAHRRPAGARGAARRRAARPRLARRGAGGGSPRARARQPAQPDRSRVDARRTGRDRRALRRARRLGAGRRDPRAADAARRDVHRLAGGLRRRAGDRRQPHLGVEGVQRRRAQVGAGRDRLRARAGAGRGGSGASTTTRGCSARSRPRRRSPTATHGSTRCSRSWTPTARG